MASKRTLVRPAAMALGRTQPDGPIDIRTRARSEIHDSTLIADGLPFNC